MSNDKAMKPRLLLVEDDAISRTFMVAALEGIAAHVDTADCMAAALLLESGHDAWLLDANLPDGSGIELLQALRMRSPSVPALAHTADDSPALRTQLIAAGFADVLIKPLGAAHLLDAVRQALGDAPATRFRVNEPAIASSLLPLWDEGIALAALNGNVQHVATLRKLFLDELPQQRDAIIAALAANDHAVAKHHLHQLKASSGFVGAMRLNAAAAGLEEVLGDAGTVVVFTTTVDDTFSSG